MRAVLLTYNLSGERLSMMKFICMKNGCAVRTVAPEEQRQTLGALVGLEQPKDGAAGPAMPFTDEVLVMAGFTNRQVDGLLSAMKQFRMAPVALKAVLTPTNQHWDGYTLVTELRKEHAAMQQGRQAHKADEAQG